jgi:hypothetical protein
MWRKLEAACACVLRALWTVIGCAAKTIVTILTVLLVGMAAAFGGRLRIEDPPPKNPVVQVDEKD